MPCKITLKLVSAEIDVCGGGCISCILSVSVVFLVFVVLVVAIIGVAVDEKGGNGGQKF